MYFLFRLIVDEFFTYLQSYMVLSIRLTGHGLKDQYIKKKKSCSPAKKLIQTLTRTLFCSFFDFYSFIFEFYCCNAEKIISKVNIETENNYVRNWVGPCQRQRYQPKSKNVKNHRGIGILQEQQRETGMRGYSFECGRVQTSLRVYYDFQFMACWLQSYWSILLYLTLKQHRKSLFINYYSNKVW